MTLAVGEHRFDLSAPGFKPFSETITVQSGEEGMYSPSLADITPPTVKLTVGQTDLPWDGVTHVHVETADNAGMTEVQLLLGDDLLGDVQGSALDYDLVPSDVPGLAGGGTFALTARAINGAGNSGEAVAHLTIIGPATPGAPVAAAAAATGQATPAEIATATPAGPADEAPAAVEAEPTAGAFAAPLRAPAAGTTISTSVVVTDITIPTYPFAAYLQTVVDPAEADYPVPVLDREAYDAAQPQPSLQTYTLITLENSYLRLSILPDLGGRIYECVYKPTGHDELYRNPVIKPTHWGPGTPEHPVGANWWLAAGGIEWGFPVEEHGYEWGTKWGYEPVSLPDGSAMVSLFTGDARRPYVVVDIILPPDSTAFVVRPHITNPIGASFRYKWWHNAMVAPGGSNTVGPNLHFIVPTKEMTVHSTDDSSLPAAGQELPWPEYQGRDLSRLGNWNQYLGLFARPAAQADFMAVYDTSVDEGLVRAYPSEVVKGAKIFAAGYRQPLDWHEWTDDPANQGSSYVEMHGGLAPTFDDWNELGPGDSVSWSETWYPVAGIGDVTFASAGGAMNVASAGNGVQVRLFVTQPVRGRLAITAPGSAPVSRQVEIMPDRPYSELVATSGAPGDVKVVLSDEQGLPVLSNSR